jgi:SAM-dependent methyltransferase
MLIFFATFIAWLCELLALSLCRPIAMSPPTTIVLGNMNTAGEGRLHHTIADRTAALATSTAARPRHLLDVGCGTGYLLRKLAGRSPEAEQFNSIDADGIDCGFRDPSGNSLRVTQLADIGANTPD